MDPPTGLDRLTIQIHGIIIQIPMIGERDQFVFNAKSEDIMLMSVLIQRNLKIMYHCVEIIKEFVILQINVLSLKLNINLMREIGRKNNMSKFKKVMRMVAL